MIVKFKMDLRVYAAVALAVLAFGGEVSAIRCPGRDWYYRNATSSCYFIFGSTPESIAPYSASTEHTSFHGAIRQCKIRGGKLLTVEDANEFEWLRAKLQPSKWYWVGLTYQNLTWEWHDGETFRPYRLNETPNLNVTISSSYSYYTDDQKRNLRASLYYQSGTNKFEPYVETATVNNGYICKGTWSSRPWCKTEEMWTYSDGRCHKNYPVSDSFHRAESTCIGQGGHISSIKNEYEDARLKKWLRETMNLERAWLGITIANKTSAHVAANVAWLDGTAVTNSTVNNWMTRNITSYIDNLPNDETYCGEMYTRKSGYVNSQYIYDSHDWVLRNQCHEAKPFSCETPLNKCPYGWHELGDKCYQFNFGDDRLRDFQSAQNDCKAQKGDLIVIEDQKTQEFVEKALEQVFDWSNFDLHYYWIGLKSTNGAAFTWVDGSGLNFTAWSSLSNTAPVTPSTDTCVYIDGDLPPWYNERHGDWNITLCTQRIGYICQAHYTAEIPPVETVYPAHSCEAPYVKYHEGCYLVVKQQKTRGDAQQYCTENQGGRLAIINTFGENSWLQDQVLKDSWIGIQITKDNGLTASPRFGYSYSDGTPVGAGAFTRFYDSISYNSDPAFNRFCVAMAGIGSTYNTTQYTYSTPTRGHWYHAPCTDTREFVCSHTGKEYPQPDNENHNDPVCGAGWFRNGDNCYRLNKDPTPWRLAKSLCQNYDGTSDLLYVTSKQEEQFIQDFVERNLSSPIWNGWSFDNLVNANYWIDLYRESTGVWHWPFRNVVNKWHIPLSVTNWAPNQPSAHTGSPRCAYIQGVAQSAQWHSTNCDASHAYICKKTLPKAPTTPRPIVTPIPGLTLGCPQHWSEVDNRCIRFNLTKTDWSTARSICRQHNKGDLISVRNEQEFHGIKTFAAGTWIGLNSVANPNNPRVFEWSDGSAMSYTPWDVESASSNSTGFLDVNCGSATSTGFALYSCSERKSFICEMALQSINSSNPGSLEIPHDRGCHLWGMNFHQSCYYFGEDPNTPSGIRTPYNFEDARQFCQSKFGADLVVINDLAEREYLNAWIARSATEFWIGLRQGDEPWSAFKKWIDGTNVYQTNWAWNQPQSPEGETGCVSVHGTYKGEEELPGDWFVSKCGERKIALCEGVSTWHPPHPTRPPITGSTPSPTGCPVGWKTRDEFTNCYKSYVGRADGVIRRISWQAAEDFCRRFTNGHLASISTQEENSFIDLSVNLGSSDMNDQYWIGFYQNPLAQNRWQWSDGTPNVFSWFHPDVDHQNAEQSNCVAMEYRPPGRWIAQNCNQGRGWICEIPKGTYYEGQIIEQFPPAIERNETCGNNTADGEWFYEAQTNECLFWSKKEDTWQNAQNTCEQLRANLVTVTNRSHDFITLKSSQFAVTARPFWIGLYQTDFIERIYSWIDGHVSLYRNWETGEPDSRGTERCVAHNSQSGRWQGHNCARSFQYICARSERVRPSVPPTHAPVTGNCAAGWVAFRDNCYFISGNENKTWDEANRACIQELTVDKNLPRGDLASVHHSLENDFLITQMRGRHHYNFWIGLHENGDNVWVWSDQSRLQFNNWHMSEPLPTANTDCIEFGSGADRAGTWRSVRCTHKQGYICKAPKSPSNPPPPPPTTRCPAGYTASGENTCFIIQKLDAGQTNWNAAQQKCNSIGDRSGGIATVEDVFENAQLRILFNEMLHAEGDTIDGHRNGSAWIGMQEHLGNFAWHNTCPVFFSNFLNFYGKPSGESCVKMDRHGKWFSAGCSDSVSAEYVACERRFKPCRPAFNLTTENFYCPVDFPSECQDICYRVNVGTAHHNRPERFSFARAREECRKLEGGRLASIRSEADQKCLEKYVQSAAHGMWIGLYEAQDLASGQYVWKWEDEGHGYQPGSAYLNWADGKPEASTEIYEYWRKGCVEMLPDGKWTNVECDMYQGSGYICESRKVYRDLPRKTTTLPPDGIRPKGLSSGTTAGIVIGVLILVALVGAVGYVVKTGKTTAVIGSVRGAGSRLKASATSRISAAGFGNSNYENQTDQHPVIQDPEYHAGASDSYT